MCDNSTEEKIKTLFGNAVTVSKCIQENKDKNIGSLSEDVLTRYFDPSERKNTIKDIAKGICYGCGTLELNYTYSVCNSIFFCANCEHHVLDKHQSKCSPLIAEKNRSGDTSSKIVSILFEQQFKMSFYYISAQNDGLKQRKTFMMFSTYYFEKWKRPDNSIEQIADMAAMAGLLSVTVKTASITLNDDNFQIYLRYINNDDICFSCTNSCKTRCSRCHVHTCKKCQRDEIHFKLCKILSL
jgi:hypothetical protein